MPSKNEVEGFWIQSHRSFKVNHHWQDNPSCKKKSRILDEINLQGGTILLNDGLTDTIQSRNGTSSPTLWQFLRFISLNVLQFFTTFSTPSVDRCTRCTKSRYLRWQHLLINAASCSSLSFKSSACKTSNCGSSKSMHRFLMFLKPQIFKYVTWGQLFSTLEMPSPVIFKQSPTSRYRYLGHIRPIFLRHSLVKFTLVGMLRDLAREFTMTSVSLASSFLRFVFPRSRRDIVSWSYTMSS